MEDFWEEWREQLSETQPGVKPDYSNRLGVWHHDFFRERITRDCGDMKRGWRRPSLGYEGPTIFDGGYCKAGLLRRGWTRTAIKRILGEPDWHLYGGYGKGKEVCMYSTERVMAAEEKGVIRYRRFNPKEPEEHIVWRPGGANGRYYRGLPLPGGDPATWLGSLRREDFYWVGVGYPWILDRLVFLSQEQVLLIYVSHSSHVTWPCPKCDRACGLYDHRPERAWLRGWLPIFSSTGDLDRAVPAAVVGRLPRCRCPKHGVSSIRPLLPFGEVDGDPLETEIEWVIRP